MTHWEIAILICRVAIYASIAGAIGGGISCLIARPDFSLYPKLRRYCYLSCTMGLIASGAMLLLRNGEMLDVGWRGLFNTDMLAITWQSALGNALRPRWLGFALILLCLILIKRLPKALCGCIIIFASLMLCGAFTQAGHAIGQPFWHSIALVVHSLTAGLWLGSFYPLWLVCRHLPYHQSHKILTTYGQWARLPMLLLLSCGLLMSYQLTHWQGLSDNLYGNTLIAKITLVGLMLAIAAWHKFYATSQILQHQHCRIWLRSFYLEVALAVTILAITSALTSIMGPSH
ncbi:copper resistance D family protein [Motilimonas eburnea]|uniref:copper resistance D family protein n=1 Tax=Motilimonas eburnea TaxID=1737488 RepID=UPI001E40AE8A|nr:CopD family protein [Motilimonas eburnea]MCE2571318.1 CopD family protein [Motilimonas eburnea]